MVKHHGRLLVATLALAATSTFVLVPAASKIGTGGLSPLSTVATSAAADTGFDCMNAAKLCRWGETAAAAPDPAAPTTGTTGEVWGSTMLAAPGGSSSSSGWTTRNFAIKP